MKLLVDFDYMAFLELKELLGSTYLFSKYHETIRMVWFIGVSTFVGYLMPSQSPKRTVVVLFNP